MAQCRSTKAGGKPFWGPAMRKFEITVWFHSHTRLDCSRFDPVQRWSMGPFGTVQSGMIHVYNTASWFDQDQNWSASVNGLYGWSKISSPTSLKSATSKLLSSSLSPPINLSEVIMWASRVLPLGLNQPQPALWPSAHLKWWWGSMNRLGFALAGRTRRGLSNAVRKSRVEVLQHISALTMVV